VWVLSLVTHDLHGLMSLIPSRLSALRPARLIPLFLGLAVLLLGAPAAGQNLNVYMTASSEVVGPDDRTTYTLMVTNTGLVDLNDVSVNVQLPDHIANFPEKRSEGFDCSGSINPNVCTATGAATWTVGTLSPGQARIVFYQVRITNSAPPGSITTSLTASSSGIADIERELSVEIEPAPGVRLHVAPESGPVDPGVSQTYILTYGNIGTENLSNASLTMSLPDGTTFGSASDGGTVSGNVVTWSLDPLGIGGSGQVRITIGVDPSLPDGSVLATTAECNPNTGAPPARSSVATAVRSLEPLQIEYAVSQTVLSEGESIDVTLAVTNSSAFEMVNTLARLQLPDYISSFSERLSEGFDCFGSVNPNVCVANGGATWTVGTLAPGQSRTVTFRTFLQQGAPEGEVVRSLLLGEATGAGPIMAALDLHIDPTPLLELSLAVESGPVVADEPYTYTITTGNIGTDNPADVILRVPLPLETELVSVSDGGELIDGDVTWTIGRQLSVNAAGQAHLTVRPNASLVDGHLLSTYAELDPGSTTEVTTRSYATTSVRDNVPLRMEYTVSGVVVKPGETFSLTLTAENMGPVDLADVLARVQLPGFVQSFPENLNEGFNCFGSVNPNVCVENGGATWTVGTLLPGEQRTITFSPTIRNDAPRGSVLRSLMRGTASGSDQVVLQRDFFVADSDTQLPVELTSFTATTAGEAVTLQWQTASETNNAGFDLQRSTDSETFATVASKPGAGTTTEAQTYRFTDRDLPFAPELFYRLRQVDVDGTESLSDVVSVRLTPTRLELLPSAPNPFVQAARLRYRLPDPARVRLEVFDLLGRRVATLVDGEKEAGPHEVQLEGSRLAAGTYFVRLTAGPETQTQQIQLVR